MTQKASRTNTKASKQTQKQASKERGACSWKQTKSERDDNGGGVLEGNVVPLVDAWVKGRVLGGSRSGSNNGLGLVL